MCDMRTERPKHVRGLLVGLLALIVFASSAVAITAGDTTGLTGAVSAEADAAATDVQDRDDGRLRTGGGRFDEAGFRDGGGRSEDADDDQRDGRSRDDEHWK